MIGVSMNHHFSPDPATLATLDRIRASAAQLRCPDAFWSLRAVVEKGQVFSVRRGVPEPLAESADVGVMLSVIQGGGLGYAATADLSPMGLQGALDEALAWAKTCAQAPVFPFKPPLPGTDEATTAGGWSAPNIGTPMPTTADLFDLLRAEDAAAALDTRIVDRSASVNVTQATRLRLTSLGGEQVQHHRWVIPSLAVTAHVDGVTQTRSLAGNYNGFCRQGGFEVVLESGLIGGGSRIADEAIALAQAPECPTGLLDLLAMPDQMMLQIHESIGHPLELDRILGDERNFAGTSFVTPDMFGRYAYGSEQLTITCDPTIEHEFAAFGFDDEGTRAERAVLIERGLLLRPIGGALSAARAAAAGYALEPVACARASAWWRAPIDRMPNLNLEPGDSTLEQMIGSVDDGILVRTNLSWSIDDSRDKFQFGCEWAERIRHGQRVGVVRNPNYRGRSASFWRSLDQVGNAQTVQVMGTPYCGKGEPGQVIRVGHASPPCLFRGVEVFGGGN